MIVAQEDKKSSKLRPDKIGFYLNYGKEENFIFDDPDYTYESFAIKANATCKLKSWKSLQLLLMVMPQVQFIKHQLINEQFITPDQKNYIDKRAEFTQLKNMNLYGVEFGLSLKKPITNAISILGGFSLGFNYINTRTERLAKGFTFLENFSLGFSKEFKNESEIYLGSSFGHVSNLNFQLPNDGYNILALDVGYIFKL